MVLYVVEPPLQFCFPDRILQRIWLCFIGCALFAILMIVFTVIQGPDDCGVRGCQVLDVRHGARVTVGV